MRLWNVSVDDTVTPRIAQTKPLSRELRPTFYHGGNSNFTFKIAGKTLGNVRLTTAS